MEAAKAAVQCQGLQVAMMMMVVKVMVLMMMLEMEIIFGGL